MCITYAHCRYATALELTEKSDVYSFGVVLLEVITGQPPFVQIPQAQPIHIIKWVQQRLSSGDIEGVVDARMRGEYDVNGVWKVADLALECTARIPEQRPTMTRVMALLVEYLELEESRVIFYTGCSSDPNSCSTMYATDQSNSDVAESSMGAHSGSASTETSGPAER
jgi:serine/threonine protein kinase